MFEIGKQWIFDASHHLPSLPAGHKCSRVHGHTYRVKATVGSSLLSGPGFVTDFGDLAPFGKYLNDHVDHRDLNEVFAFEPTSELLAQHFAQWFIDNLQPRISGRLLAMEVSETPSTWARYVVSPEDSR
jgi:6-pyruvoyltetrahydropterin/6-carboxytetrahydropterin synthase